MSSKHTLGRILGLISKDKSLGNGRENHKAVSGEEDARKAASEKKDNNDNQLVALKKNDKDQRNLQSSPENSGQEYVSLSSVTRIYERNRIDSDGMGTIFMAEAYLKTLPDHLPYEVKRKTVLDIIRSTGVTIDQLQKDGEKRKRALADYLQKFSETTNRLIEGHQTEMRKLTNQIQEHEKAILERKSLQKEQTALVNYESERLQRVIDFLEGDVVDTQLT